MLGQIRQQKAVFFQLVICSTTINADTEKLQWNTIQKQFSSLILGAGVLVKNNTWRDGRAVIAQIKTEFGCLNKIGAWGVVLAKNLLSV